VNEPVKVRICVEGHRHGDLEVPKGAVLEVSPNTAAHFKALGIAEDLIATKTANPKEVD
jgi:hypothetical protein